MSDCTYPFAEFWRAGGVSVSVSDLGDTPTPFIIYPQLTHFDFIKTTRLNFIK